jgi:hypothetical protein
MLWLHVLYLHQQTTNVFSSILRHNGVPHFPSDIPAISFRNLQKIPKKKGQDNHPGNDVNEDAPIGYSVNTDALLKKGVIHQWEIFFL